MICPVAPSPLPCTRSLNLRRGLGARDPTLVDAWADCSSACSRPQFQICSPDIPSHERPSECWGDKPVAWGKLKAQPGAPHMVNAHCTWTVCLLVPTPAPPPSHLVSVTAPPGLPARVPLFLPLPCIHCPSPSVCSLPHSGLWPPAADSLIPAHLVCGSWGLFVKTRLCDPTKSWCRTRACTLVRRSP